jgi:hypothetical protein
MGKEIDVARHPMAEISAGKCCAAAQMARHTLLTPPDELEHSRRQDASIEIARHVQPPMEASSAAEARVTTTTFP